MTVLPLLLDADEAIQYFRNSDSLSDAVKATVVAAMHNDGYSNKQIRDSLNIKEVYTITHLKRVGTSLSQNELSLWHRNPTKITLGHVKAITKLAGPLREALLRKLLSTKMSVRQFEKIGQEKEIEQDADTKRYAEEMGKCLGRPIKITYNASNKTGSITLGFFKLTDLEDMANCLGYKPNDNYY